jgi:hypothetical protein
MMSLPPAGLRNDLKGSLVMLARCVAGDLSQKELTHVEMQSATATIVISAAIQLWFDVCANSAHSRIPVTEEPIGIAIRSHCLLIIERWTATATPYFGNRPIATSDREPEVSGIRP